MDWIETHITNPFLEILNKEYGLLSILILISAFLYIVKKQWDIQVKEKEVIDMIEGIGEKTRTEYDKMKDHIIDYLKILLMSGRK